METGMAKKRLSTWLGALLGAILALVFSAYAHAQEFTEEFHHTYPLSANGSVEISKVNANVTASGLVSSAEVTTVNSRAEADFTSLPASGHIRVHSVNGSAIIVMPANSNAELRAHSINGSIHNDFNLPIDRPRYGPGSRLEGKIGAGGPDVELDTVNGGIQIRQH